MPEATVDDAGDKEAISFDFGTLLDCEQHVDKEMSTENPFELTPKTHKLR